MRMEIKNWMAVKIKYSKAFGLVLSYALCLISNTSFAQEERALTRDGNKLFDKGKYSDAEAAYKKALDKKNNFTEAIFNLGDAQYKQNRYEDAGKQFQLASKVLTDPKLKAGAFHNMGNTFLEQKKYEDAVSAYKQALKVNANDRDTKYNLAYANAMLKQQQQNQKDNKDNKDQKKDDPNKKDKKDDKGKQDKKDDQKDNKDGKGDKDKDNKEPQPKKGNRQELSKEQADKLLEALKNEEQKTQQKMQQKNAKPNEVKIEKDW